MSQLYTVSFTPKILTTVVGRGGKVIETRHTAPVVLTALPYAAAMSYKTAGADNFTITPYEPTDRYRSKGAGRDEKIGNGTKHAGRATANAVIAAASKPKTKPNTTVSAAKSGDMSAAINGAR